MNEQIKAGADIHAGDGGYSISNKEKYEAFVKLRNQSMNEKLKELMLEAGYAFPEGATRAHKLAELIVRECGVALSPMLRDMVSRGQAYDLIKKHFGVED